MKSKAGNGRGYAAIQIRVLTRDNTPPLGVVAVVGKEGGTNWASGSAGRMGTIGNIMIRGGAIKALIMDHTLRAAVLGRSLPWG
jgi:hypothetical protein